MLATPAQIKKLNEMGLQIMYDSQTTAEEARQIIIDNLPKPPSETKRKLATDFKTDTFSVNSDWRD